MKIIQLNRVGSRFYPLCRCKAVHLLVAVLLQCSVCIPYAFGTNRLQTSLQNQDGKVSGVVQDVTGMPLTGVSVVIKGTRQGVVTDLDGRFRMDVPEGSILVFSYIGMEPVEIRVGNRKELNVMLKENAASLDEVVVIGYGTVKKSNLSGAVSSVSSKDLQKLPAANLSQALQGNAPGLYSLQSSRDPGATVSLNIRGDNSFIGGDPLFIVDGFPIASEGGVNAINPNDIESVSILKDASSTAIYGARAANGVILITTKSGKTGKTILEVNAYCGIKYFNNPIKMMGASQFAQLRRESYEMDGIALPSNAFLPAEQQMLDLGRSTNWWKEVTGTARLTQNYQVSFSSGTETTQVHVGAGFFDEQGIVNNSSYKRGSLRFNASQKFGDRVKISTFNNISLIAKKGINETNVLFPSVVGNPLSPVRNEKGEFYAMIQNALGTPRANPVAFSELPKNNETEPLINTSLAVEIKLMSGLNFKSQLSGEIDNYKKNFYNPRSISGEDEINGRISGGYASVTSSVNYNWISETTLMYNQTFNKIHTIDAVAGFSVQQNRWETVTASASGFASDVYESFNLGASSSAARKPSSELQEWSMVSYIGRAVYTLKDKYIFTANLRVDGSSRFGENNKYGLFPSGAVTWKISEEKFMESLDWLSDMKVRASYGLSGNANALKPYQTMSKLAYAPYNFNSSEAPGYYESNMPSADLKWETTRQLDVGLDFSVLNRRLNIVLDYYAKNTTDLIRAIDIPAVSGFPSTYVNMGDLQNRGCELEINSVNLDGEFVWKTSFMIASNKNKLTSLGDGSEKIGTSHWVGKPISIGYRYMIQADGIWQADQKEEAATYGSVPGDVKYVDQNKDGKINDEDRVFVGSYYPNFYGSLTNDFAYKNFDLSVFMTFEQGRDIYNGNNYILLSGAGVDNNRIEMTDRWTPAHPSHKYPRASATGNNRLSTTTSEFLEDGSYLKIKNITLGYTIPSKIISKTGMSHFRVYASVNNPFTFTQYTGMDPEDGDIWNNDRKSTYPITTSYMLGLQLTF